MKELVDMFTGPSFILLPVIIAVLLVVGYYLFKRRTTSPEIHSKGRPQIQSFSSEKTYLLLEGSGLGVFECDFDGDCARSMQWSERMFQLLGLNRAATAPNMALFFSLIYSEDRAAIVNLFQNRSQSDSFECRMRVAGEFRWFRGRKIILADADQGRDLIIGCIEDVHEQKMAQEKIRQMNLSLEEEIKKRTSQLEKTSHAKTRFLANMAHEIRTPLGLILGFAELLTEDRQLGPESKEYVALITKNGEMLYRIINDLLDLSKIEAGKLRFQYSRVLLGDILSDLEKSFSEKSEKQGVELVFENTCSPQETVVTDEIRLKQIIYNLLSNALKFTPKGKIRVHIGKQDSLIVFDIIDTGMGIPESEKATIFNEYVRGELADSDATGTGLGLRLAQNLAVALGGGVRLISSQVGKGSHFQMSFQSDEKKLQEQSERKHDLEMSSQLQSFEVFVLDDNEDNIRLAEIFLRRLGCRVRGFTSPKSLFAEMASATPDLMLLDINMPEMNGFQVFDHLRKIGYQNPIWALTAYSLNEDIKKILDYGFDDYIRKPISIDGMKRKLAFELKERVHD